MKHILKFGGFVWFFTVVSGVLAGGYADPSPQKNPLSDQTSKMDDLKKKHSTLHDLFVIGSPAPQSLEGQDRLRSMGPTGCAVRNLTIVASKDLPKMGSAGTNIAGHLYPEVVGSFGRESLPPESQERIMASLKPMLMTGYKEKTAAE
jgi:hypothetical protein